MDALRLADASRHGLTRGVLRGSSWTVPTHGVYAPRGATDDLMGRCRATALALPDGAAYSHLTAAALRRVWLPGQPAWLPLFAALPPGATRPLRRGLWLTRTRSGAFPPIWIGDVRCVPVVEMVGQLADDLPLVDLVVAIDCVVNRRLCTVLDIAQAIRPRQRGAPRLRAALALADGRSESPWETVLRLLHVLGGFATVEPQKVITSPTGRFLARADLALAGTNRLAEYDGAHHRRGEQHAEDLRRQRELARAGYERYGYVKADIVDDPGRILRDAEDAYGLPPDPGRLQAWWPSFKASTFSSTGWSRWLHRLRRYDRAAS